MFQFHTAGESHGKALSIIVQGVPAGLPLIESEIAVQLRRRQGGYGRGGRMKIEQDHAEILAGVRHGLTLGTPISLLIRNRDWENWQEKMAVEPVEGPVERVTRLRPGHADLPGAIKYLFDDVRPVLERASARETAARVAAGAVARRLLQEFGVEFYGRVVAIGGVAAPEEDEPDWQRIEASPVRCHDSATEERMIAAIDAAKQDGDTVGGIVEVRARGVPIGLGSHVQWDRKLDGQIAQAVCSINAFKAVGFGAGFAATSRPGSRIHDVILPSDQWEGRAWRHASNRHGGIIGGISTGEEIVIQAAIKPIPTLAHPLPSVDLDSGEEVLAHYERSDVCVVPAGVVVAEAMLALVLAGALLEKFGGDHLQETLRNYRAYMETVGPRAAAARAAAVGAGDD
ncbi:MAG: chorismate synthase [Dehalococcoidia bacterium]